MTKMLGRILLAILLVLIVITLLLGCAGDRPPNIPPHGAIHEIVAYYHHDKFIYGTCFATDDHTLVTASHIVIGDPETIMVDGHEVFLMSFSTTDQTPAFLYSPEELHDILNVVTPTCNAFGNIDSIWFVEEGQSFLSDHSFLGYPKSIPGCSGAPVIDVAGNVIGVQWGGDGIYEYWYPIK
jgi:hypothetical protein